MLAFPMFGSSTSKDIKAPKGQRALGLLLSILD